MQALSNLLEEQEVVPVRSVQVPEAAQPYPDRKPVPTGSKEA